MAQPVQGGPRRHVAGARQRVPHRAGRPRLLLRPCAAAGSLGRRRRPPLVPGSVGPRERDTPRVQGRRGASVPVRPVQHRVPGSLADGRSRFSLLRTRRRLPPQRHAGAARGRHRAAGRRNHQAEARRTR